MDETRPTRNSTRWILALLVGAVVGLAVGYSLRAASAPALQGAQPVLDALLKEAPPPPFGKVLGHHPNRPGFDGPDKNNLATVRVVDAYVIDITGVSNDDAVQKIINSYKEYYATATGIKWGSSNGDRSPCLYKTNTGEFGVYSSGYKLASDHYEEGSGGDLHIDAEVLDFPAGTVGMGKSNDVGSLSDPVKGQRILWLRCHLAVHSLTGPVKLRS